MIEYTEKELEILKSSLTYTNECISQDYGSLSYSRLMEEVTYEYAMENTDSEKIHVRITRHDSTIKQVTFIELRYQIFKDLLEKKEIPIKWLYKFFYETDLREVPLYLNKYPELATWRLKIGK